MPRKRALVSVYDKEGIVDFAKGLVELGYELVSSSGTAKHLAASGVSVKEVADLTGYPHMLGGRVKTLHPSIIGGILARRHFQEDLNDVETFNIPLIDMVICNLYPFERAWEEGADLENLLENIDIGGVTLIRAAAKNYHQVVCVVDKADYNRILKEINDEGNVTLKTRGELALKAFSYTSWYDTAIYRGLMSQIAAIDEELPEMIPLSLRRDISLRYGENPHQKAGLYTIPIADKAWIQLSGKPLSYNNILDMDCAFRAISILQQDCACVIIKHTTPCGVAVGETTQQAYKKALACDPVSAFGGIIGFSRKVDLATAKELAEKFVEVVVAPGYEQEAVEYIKEKRENTRLIEWKGQRFMPLQLTGTWSGILVQEDKLPPLPDPNAGEWVGKPRLDLWDDLITAWKSVYLCKSNAIAIVKDLATVGLGSGFTSRVDAVKWAINQAGEKALGAVLASDAFFPFPDSVEYAKEAGIAAIIQPGGSVNDHKVKEAAMKAGISMFLSGWRTFRH
ncbi:bifunctional phosphoribosylaminoimidazolecarboxamide formyltransferase/IMP cyclohydrolase [Thermovirga lienii]|jgi:phosphoribosylaminoimidazolecarboxamide formyltransferase/IMP cyclohydrolase|uniref:bifunctional phosphoribosylaminoimidazolecarboxamide formyltransferase/IMP cyclohydrolase n=1 Tax=Thermovirga lienii TaxID=336261 RepID=UPI000EE610C7|nr:phosphoribosylaminoimidazolecarboxamide formyltransferase / cyclohydrolase [Thermovirga sp.]MDN5367309.1 phosphoribosylaminoimidazolecarboxamide formyltransferase / cyclohydrolase [Thermovirga sp.]HCD71956.1 bifunctional phosphoribosylaminoimidazolecarboxamide formyltransferase/IMP cyclohydrolase PurH [Thermovirga lienii]